MRRHTLLLSLAWVTLGACNDGPLLTEVAIDSGMRVLAAASPSSSRPATQSTGWSALVDDMLDRLLPAVGEPGDEVRLALLQVRATNGSAQFAALDHADRQLALLEATAAPEHAADAGALRLELDAVAGLLTPAGRKKK